MLSLIPREELLLSLDSIISVCEFSAGQGCAPKEKEEQKDTVRSHRCPYLP